MSKPTRRFSMIDSIRNRMISMVQHSIEILSFSPKQESLSSSSPSPLLTNNNNHNDSNCSIGDVWSGEEESFQAYFIDKTLRSISVVSSESTSTSTLKSKSKSKQGKSNNNNNDNNAKRLRIAFRNLSSIPLILCWISENGSLHHFYTIPPISMSTVSSYYNDNNNNNGWKHVLSNLFLRKHHHKRMLENNNDNNNSIRMIYDEWDHVETTQQGHAFCWIQPPPKDDDNHNDDGYDSINVRKLINTWIKEQEEEMMRQQKSQKIKNSKHKKSTKTRISSSSTTTAISPPRIVGGYRPHFTHDNHKNNNNNNNHDDHDLIHLVTISQQGQQQRQEQQQQRLLGRKRRFPSLAMGLVLKTKNKKLAKLDSTSTSSTTETGHDDNSNDTKWIVHASRIQLRDSIPYDTTQKVYQKEIISNWTVYFEPNWNNGDTSYAKRLVQDIQAATNALPIHARNELQQQNRHNCSIWVNKSIQYGPQTCPIKGSACCYHSEQEWLIRNGLCFEKYKCIEINEGQWYKDNTKLWGCGGLILHELCHAYHDLCVPNGFENEDIQQCYEAAMKEGLYDCVQYHSFHGITKEDKAYACTNCMEYFAELSVAFLGGICRSGDDDGSGKATRFANNNITTSNHNGEMEEDKEEEEYNKWYPFNRKQIQEHDPRAYEMLCRIWKVSPVEEKQKQKRKRKRHDHKHRRRHRQKKSLTDDTIG